MKGELLAAIILVIAAFCLTVCRSYFVYESFTDYNTNPPVDMCGVDLAPCPFGSRCINGHCRKDTLPYFPSSSGLPVLPKGYMKL